MSRKKYTRIEDASDSVLKFREKRKWQIALRRYVVEESLCVNYAPYFGLDIKSIRKWFENQFTGDMSWESFGKTWQFEHIIPVVYFDFSKEEDLFLCWNFLNLTVASLAQNQDRGRRFDFLMCRNYFNDIYKVTQQPVCKRLLDKIDTIELSQEISTISQVNFLETHKDYLKKLSAYSFYEFELLNSGRSLDDIDKERAVLKSIGAVKQ